MRHLVKLICLEAKLLIHLLHQFYKRLKEDCSGLVHQNKVVEVCLALVNQSPQVEVVCLEQVDPHHLQLEEACLVQVQEPQLLNLLLVFLEMLHLVEVFLELVLVLLSKLKVEVNQTPYLLHHPKSDLEDRLKVLLYLVELLKLLPQVLYLELVTHQLIAQQV